MAKILVVDDEPKLGRVVAEMLEGSGHEVTRAGGGREALLRITPGAFDIVLTDLRMPEVDGMAVLRAVRSSAPATEVVMMTAHATAQNAVEAMREGAIDYLIKPFAMDELRLRIDRIASRRALAIRAHALATRLDAHEGFGRVIAHSAAMQEVIGLARRVAQTDDSVLLLGESGTGKSLLARAIHHASARASGPLIEVHAAALPESLFEGELFGRERGAYTGATTSAAGHAEAADGGTLFLDEIGELTLTMQAKLLRLVQERTFMRVGSTQQRHTNVRIIAATNRDLDAAVRVGAFREDLFYRIAVFPLTMPPLRERPEDVRATALALFAIRGFGADRISDGVLDALCAHPWPGNVRELENVVNRAAVLAGSSSITVEHLPATIASIGGMSSTVLDDLLVPGFSFDRLERDLIQHAIEKAGGNKAAAARLLGITRRRLYSRLHSQAEDDDDEP